MKSVLKIGDTEIVVTHPEGTKLKMEGNTLSLGNPAQRSIEKQLDVEMQAEGIQWGDAVAWITKKAGLKECPECRARRQILNNAKNLGVKETVRQIKETIPWLQAISRT